MKITSIMLLCSGISIYGQAQQTLDTAFDRMPVTPVKVIDTYKSTRIVQGQSNEMLHKHELDFRIAHRFGDAAGQFGGIRTFFGTDNATDIRIAFEYGLSDNLMTGIGRSSGSGALQQLYEGFVKYRLLHQTTDDRVPLSMAFLGSMVISGMPSNSDVTAASHFAAVSDRVSYLAQAIISKKFASKLSLTLIPTFIHRNYVAYKDMNNLFALGAAGRLKLSKRVGLLAEYYYPFRSQESKNYFKAYKNMTFYNPLGAGLEIETGGHVFSIIFTNSTAILENQFIPETTTSWLQGQFRWGFNISRRFTLFGRKDWKK